MKIKLYLLLFALSGITLGAWAQPPKSEIDPALVDVVEEEEEDDVLGFYIGLNMGAYFANNYDAELYRGYGFQRDGTPNNFSNSWLNEAVNGGGNPEVQRDVATALGVAPNEYEFNESDMPAPMRFNPAISIGLHIRYNITQNSAIFLDINGVPRLVTVGQFTIRTLTTPANPIDGQLTYHGIRGEEQRLWFNLGWNKIFPNKNGGTLSPFVEFGANFHLAQYEENFIQINNYTRDLSVRLNQISQVQDQAIRQSSFAAGGFGGGGAHLRMGGKFEIQLGYNAMFTEIGLLSEPKRTLQHAVFLRAIWM